jgi:hypothetical protein
MHTDILGYYLLSSTIAIDARTLRFRFVRCPFVTQK